MLLELLLTCHVGGEGSVRSPAGVPAHNFTSGHQGALIRPAAYKSHGPDRHSSSTAHLQRRRKESVNRLHPGWAHTCVIFMHFKRKDGWSTRTQSCPLSSDICKALWFESWRHRRLFSDPHPVFEANRTWCVSPGAMSTLSGRDKVEKPQKALKWIARVSLYEWLEILNFIWNVGKSSV